MQKRRDYQLRREEEGDGEEEEEENKKSEAGSVVGVDFE